MAATPAQLAALLKASILEIEGIFDELRLSGKCGIYRIRAIRVNGEVVDPSALVLTQTTKQTALDDTVAIDEELESTDQSLTDGVNNTQNGGIRYGGRATDGSWVTIPDVSEAPIPAMPADPAGHTLEE